jgi:uncharacterized protein YbjT (DUF2867 family)
VAAAARSHSGPAAATGSHTRTLLARIAAILNVFGGVLTFKRKAEEALEASGLPYVIVRPGGMERPRDDHKLTHNVRLATRDKLFGGTVSRLQVAELVAAAVASPELAENKVLEVVAETAAPALSYDELLAAHPSEESQEEREAAREAAAALAAEIAEAQAALADAEGSLAEIRERIKSATAAAAEARQREQAVRKEQGEVLKQAERAEKQVGCAGTAPQRMHAQAAGGGAAALPSPLFCCNSLWSVCVPAVLLCARGSVCVALPSRLCLLPCHSWRRCAPTPSRRRAWRPLPRPWCRRRRWRSARHAC